MFEWLDNHAGAVQAVTTIVLVLITTYYAWQTRGQAMAARIATEEMKRTREAQAQAHVTLELWPWDRRLRFFDMAIRNYGAGAARDIRVVFDPDFRQPQYQGGTMNELQIMRNLPFLAPNDQVLFFLGTRDWILAEDLPDIWTGSVHYTDDTGQRATQFRINPRQYERLQSMLPGDGPRFAPPLRRGFGPVEQFEKPDPPPRILR